MKGQLIKNNDICILLYQGNVSGGESLFKQMFENEEIIPSMKDLAYSIHALNLSIYYYILSRENVSLDNLCLKLREEIDKCPYQFDDLYQMGLNVIHQYGYCKEYLIEKYDNEHIKNILRYIHKHLGDPLLSLESIADNIGLVKNYLAQLFKQETNKTIHEYIMDERLKFSISLLQKKHLSISAISETCGFNSTTYFSTAFRKKYKITPKQYQKNYNNEENKH